MTNKPSKPENQPAPADERNIVSLDSNYEGASLEDQVFLFWHKYKNIIIAIVVVAVLALIGWGLITYMQDRREGRIRGEYQLAVSIDELKAFAERNSGHELAGVASLRAADYHFENGEFAEAAGLYQRAINDLDTAALRGRAQIGRGVALALAGQANDALNHFEEIARNPDNLAAIRSEAHYHSASLSVEAGRIDAARTHIERVMELDQSRIWASRAMGLQQALPPPAASEETQP
jgi:tetratricopeptide (TPR) repeat protein